MSEQTLNSIIRHLRMSASYLSASSTIADKVLVNHKVAEDINRLTLSVNDYIRELDINYRENHFKKQRR